MLPLLRREVVEKRQLATEDEILNYFAVGQCTPGIIAVNTATFIGYKRRGVIGGIVTTLGLVTPSIIIIGIIARVLNEFSEIAWVAHAFAGIRIAVVALVFEALIKFMKAGVKTAVAVILFLGSFALAVFADVSAVWIVIGAVVIGIAYGFLLERLQNKEDPK